MEWFVLHPERIAVVAAAFGGAWLLRVARRGWPIRRRDCGLLLAAGAWGLAALWEALIVRTSADANIRIDLLLVVPFVLAATVLGVYLDVRQMLRRA